MYRFINLSNTNSIILFCVTLFIMILMVGLFFIKKIRKTFWFSIIPFIVALTYAITLSIVFNSWKMEAQKLQQNQLPLYEIVQFLNSINLLFVSSFIFISIIYMFGHTILSSYRMMRNKTIYNKIWFKKILKNIFLVGIFILFNYIFYFLKIDQFDSEYMFSANWTKYNNLFSHYSYLSFTAHNLYNFFGKWYLAVSVISLYIIGYIIGVILYYVKKQRFIIVLSIINKKLPLYIVATSAMATFTMTSEILLKSFGGLFYHMLLVTFVFLLIIITIFVYILIKNRKLGAKKVALNTTKILFNTAERKNYLNYLIRHDIESEAYNFKNTIVSVIMIGFLAFANMYGNGSIFNKWYVYLTVFISLIIKSGLVYNWTTNTSILKWSSITGVITIKPGAQTGAIGLVFTYAEKIIYHILSYDEYLTLLRENQTQSNRN